MNNRVIYGFNGEFWKQLSEDELENFLGRTAEKMGINVFDARYYNFKSDMLKQFVSSSFLSRLNKKNEETMIILKMALL